MTDILCSNCHRPYPAEGTPFRCTTCGGYYDWPELPPYQESRVDTTLPGIWRFRHALGLPAEAPQVYLGEGNTPLIWAKVLGKDIAFKLEFLNPTGSFKDRGSAALVSFLLSRGVKTAVEDSSGNAGASYAAYAARAGIRAQVFVPDYASGPKRRQIEAYGAQVVRIPGPRSNTSEAVLRAVESGEIYASHAYMPFCLPGYATAAYEIFEQLGQAPGAVICPVGQGNLLLSIGRGFQALKKAGLVDRLPVLIGVQALACAPVWALWRYGPTGLGWVAEGETLAEGVRVKYPLRGDALLRTVEESGGMFFAVAEEDIPLGADQLARLGLYVEPTSAIVWNALQQVVEQMPGPLVVMLTGSGLKYQG